MNSGREGLEGLWDVGYFGVWVFLGGWEGSGVQGGRRWSWSAASLARWRVVCSAGPRVLPTHPPLPSLTSVSNRRTLPAYSGNAIGNCSLQELTRL